MAVLGQAVGFAWIGAAFLSYSLYLSLLPSVSIALAALLTALVCVAIGGLLVAVAMPRAQPSAALPPQAPPVEAGLVEVGAMTKSLSELARDHPIMAVVAAALLGATTASSAQRRH